MNKKSEKERHAAVGHAGLTSKELARLCGVSQGTVDRALNNRAGISEKTRKKVLDAAQAYGYVKNRYASALSSGKSGLIGVVMLHLKNEFFSHMLTAIEQQARVLGYSVVIMLSHGSEEEERACIRRLCGMQAAGILLCSVSRDGAFLEGCPCPVVTLANHVGKTNSNSGSNSTDVSITGSTGKSNTCSNVGNTNNTHNQAGSGADHSSLLSFVGIDDRQAMYDATRYVIARGYERLLYYSPVLALEAEENIDAQKRRQQGFLQAVRECNVAEITVGSKDLGQVEQFCHDVRERGAVLCGSDYYALQCMEITLTTHTGLMGFDGIPALRYVKPALTTVHYPAERAGTAAVDLLARLAGGGEWDGREVILPHTIVEGETL